MQAEPRVCSRLKKKTFSLLEEKNEKKLFNAILIIVLLLVSLPVGAVNAENDVVWSPLSRRIGVPYILGLAVDPHDPDNIYMSTISDGVFVSNDGGENWGIGNIGLTSLEIYSLAIDPQMPGTLYVGTADSGVFKSDDGGWSWSAVNDGLTNLEIWSLAVDPQTPTTLYAGSWEGGGF